MRKFIIPVLALVAFIVLVVAGLSLLRGRAPSALLTDTLCSPPCWQDIEPGKTSEWMAISTLERMPGVSQITQWGDPEVKGMVAWKFHYPIGDSAGYIYSAERRVIAISIMTMGSMTVGEAVAKYGEPDSVWARYRKTEDRRWLEVVLHYPAQGVFVRAEIEPLVDHEHRTAELRAENPVGRVIYYDRTRYDYLIDERVLFREDRQTILDRSGPWSGLGTVHYEHLVRD